MARVSAQIQNKLSEIIDQRLNNPKIPPFVTIHSVKVANDLRVADISVTLLQDEDKEAIDEIIAELNKASGFLRTELGRVIRLKYLPALKFHYNPSTSYALGLEEIFNKDRDDPAESPDTDAPGE